MHYPIDTEEYIAAARLEFGEKPNAEEATRAVAPVVNLCYERGREDVPGYPLDPVTEIRRFEEYIGRNAPAHELLTKMVNWCNTAYEQGKHEAERCGVNAERFDA